MRTVLFAVAVLTFTRIAYAADINIAIPADELQDMRQYRRGREADEMVRKGYVCVRYGGSACSWEKLEDFGFVTKARWGKCKQSLGVPKGRMCERRTPTSAGFWYYDFERPLVLLQEKLTAAQGSSPNDDLAGIEDELPRGLVKARLVLLGIRQNTMARDLGIEVTRFNKIIGGWELATADEKRKITDYLRGAVIKLQIVSLEMARDIFARLTYEQQVKIREDFGHTIDRALLLGRATDEERQSLERNSRAVRDQTWHNIAKRVAGEDERREQPAAQAAQALEAKPAPTPDAGTPDSYVAPAAVEGFASPFSP